MTRGCRETMPCWVWANCLSHREHIVPITVTNTATCSPQAVVTSRHIRGGRVFARSFRPIFSCWQRFYLSLFIRDQETYTTGVKRREYKCHRNLRSQLEICPIKHAVWINDNSRSVTIRHAFVILYVFQEELWVHKTLIGRWLILSRVSSRNIKTSDGSFNRWYVCHVTPIHLIPRRFIQVLYL